MDIWDWLRGLKRWWWMLLVLPGLAAAVTWFAAPEPEYEVEWTLYIIFDDPNMANNPAYIDFVVLDDLALLLHTGVLGDVVYLQLPEEVRENLSRDDFGEMVESRRHAHYVWIKIHGDNAETVQTVANTIDAELPDAVNHYLIPATHTRGPANIMVMDPMTEPTLNTQTRIRTVGAVTLAAGMVALAGTGAAEWLRLSYRAKNAAR